MLIISKVFRDSQTIRFKQVKESAPDNTRFAKALSCATSVVQGGATTSCVYERQVFLWLPTALVGKSICYYFCLTVRLIKWYSHIWKVVYSRVLQVKSPMESNSKKLCILGHYEQGKRTRLFMEHIMKYFPHPQTVCTRPSPQAGGRGLGTRTVHKIMGTRC